MKGWVIALSFATLFAYNIGLVAHQARMSERIANLEKITPKFVQRTGMGQVVMIPCDGAGYQHALATTCVTTIETYRW